MSISMIYKNSNFYSSIIMTINTVYVRLLSIVSLLASLIICTVVPATTAQAGSNKDIPNVILDTDFYHFNDDHETLIMLAQLHKEKKLNLMGITVLTGNQWLDKAMVDVLRAVERMGIQHEIPVYQGADRPLVHDYNAHEQEKALYGSGYAGAWEAPRPKSDKDIVLPPDGRARKTSAQSQHAVNYIIEQVRRQPGEITILAIGPLTNIAIALRMAPDIATKIKEVIMMGGAIKVPGNVTPAAEFNWWFDPEAARMVMRSPVKKVIVPLDATNEMVFTRDIYNRLIQNKKSNSGVADIYFKPRYKKDFANDPNYFFFVWDSLVVAYLMDPSMVTSAREVLVDVNDTLGPDYGRSLGYGDKDFGVLTHPPGVTPSLVVYNMDKKRFWDFYVDLLTRPIPINKKHAIQ